MNGVPGDRIHHVWLSPPFYTPAPAISSEYDPRSAASACMWPQAVTRYSQVTSTSPDMVVYTSLFWDIGRNDDHFPERLATMSLPTDYLMEWWEHFRAILRLAKVRVRMLLHRNWG